MIAIDTSVFIAYLQGTKDAKTEQVEIALLNNGATLLPVVLSELLSDPILPKEVADSLMAFPLLELKPGYWARAGKTRAAILAKKRKARLADVLIAQMCLDYDIPLLTSDKDFAPFVTYCGLKLV
jgi:predicted nucleic acid-binding protein